MLGIVLTFQLRKLTLANKEPKPSHPHHHVFNTATNTSRPHDVFFFYRGPKGRAGKVLSWEGGRGAEREREHGIIGSPVPLLGDRRPGGLWINGKYAKLLPEPWASPLGGRDKAWVDGSFISPGLTAHLP